MIPLAIHESLSGWKGVPEASLEQVPRELRALYSRGQKEGVFRTDRAFETVYLTVIGALTALKVVLPRFSDMRKVGESGRGLAQMADRMIDLVLDGAGTTIGQPVQRRRRT
jgi:hypothetical protein